MSRPFPISRSARRLPAIGLALAIVLAGCSEPAAPEAAAPQAHEGTLTLDEIQQAALGLQAQAASKASALPVSGLAAEAVAPLDASARLVAPYAGVVTRILVDEGQDIRRGTAVVRILSREWLAAQADLARAKADALAASRQASRDDQLLAEGIISGARHEQGQATAAAAAGALHQAEGSLSGLRPVVGDLPGEYELLAPIDGRVLRRQVAPGQSVQALDEAAVIATPGRLDVVFEVPATLRPQLAPGLKIRLPGGEGEVRAIGGDTDRASQRVRVRAEAAADSALIPGQQFELTLLLPVPNDAIAVPVSALLPHGSGYLLYVRSGQDPAKASFQPVKVERLGGDDSLAVVRPQVAGQLPPGAEVVVRGASALKPLLPPEQD